jgi:hypothetical protein
VEVEPERLHGWFTRFADRHGGLTAVVRTADQVRFRTRDGASAAVAVPFGGLPPSEPTPVTPTPAPPAGSTDDPALAPPAGSTDDPAAVLEALHAHLAVPRRVGVVLVRLGGYSIGVAVDGVVESSTTGARLVHGRNRKGGSSSGRFARRRDNQARVALDAAGDAVARFLLPVADTLDAVVLGGDAAALDDLRADRRLAALLARAEPRVLDVPEPRRAVLDEAARRARSVEIVVRDAPDDQQDRPAARRRPPAGRPAGR